VNADVLNNYLDHFQKISAKRGLREDLRIEHFALLPGVIEELSTEARDPEAVWPLLEPTLRDALESLGAMRTTEGAALAADLANQCGTVEASLNKIATRSPQITELYRLRLQERIGEALAQFKAAIEPVDLVREVCLFADRSDISEEIVRLRSHLQQFLQAMQAAESAGRKLEFICQEMGRETNTIGSKPTTRKSRTRSSNQDGPRASRTTAERGVTATRVGGPPHLDFPPTVSSRQPHPCSPSPILNSTP
jgi:uncharacterized protein (TIGR00255 family)